MALDFPRAGGAVTLATIIVALQLVPLHQVDGRVILVNPNEITAVATPRRGDQKLNSLDPATGTPWTAASLNAAQAGVRVES